MLEACCYTCCTVLYSSSGGPPLLLQVHLLHIMRHLPLLLPPPPFFPPTSRRRRRRIGIGHGKEEEGKGEWRRALEIPLHGTEEHRACRGGLSVFRAAMFKNAPGLPTPSDRRPMTGGGPEDPRPNTAKIHLVRYCRGTGGGKKKRSIPSRPYFFVPFSLFSPSLQRAVLHSAYPISGSPPTLFLFPFLRRSGAREIFMLP